jgi:HK97 family phage prohead protease
MNTSPIELRSATAPGSVGTLAGRVNYNSPSAPLSGHGRASFVEIIAPGAFAATLRAKTAIVLTAGHRSDDPLAVLARWPSGGLTLRDTAAGLEWSAVLPDTRAARDLVALVKAKAIVGASFEFRVLSGGERWERVGGIERRTITAAELVEINPVTSPAYPSNTVEARRRNSAAELHPITGAQAARLGLRFPDHDRDRRARILHLAP